MMTNVRDTTFVEQLHNKDKMIPASPEVLLTGVQAFRNVSPQLMPLQTRVSVTGPPTPTNWPGAPRLQGATVEFDLNGQAQRNRFREHPLHSVPGAFPQQPIVMYTNNGQAAFIASPQDAMAFAGAPRVDQTHRGGTGPHGVVYGAQGAHERPFKNAHVTSATFDGVTVPFANANAPRCMLAKSNTFSAADGHANNPGPLRFPASNGPSGLNGPTGPDARDRLVNPAGRNGSNRPSNGNWTNHNNSAPPHWPNAGASPVTPNWTPNHDPSSPNWTIQNTGNTLPNASPNANWPSYAQGHAHAHGNHGHANRGTPRSSKTPRSINLIAIVATGSQSAATSSTTQSAATVSNSSAANVTSSSSSADSASAKSQSPATPKTSSTSELPAELPAEQPAASETSSQSERLASPPLATITSCECDTGRPGDSASTSIDVASPPDSATQTTEWHSASSSPASTSGIATPTRTSTSNKFGLTFGAEFSAEIDNIVNPNRSERNAGVAITMNAAEVDGAQNQPEENCNNPTESAPPNSTLVADKADASAASASSEPAAHNLAAVSEATTKGSETAPSVVSRPAGNNSQKQKHANQSNERTKRTDSSGKNARLAPQMAHIANELERSFEDVQKRARKPVIRFSSQRTCFHQQHSASVCANSSANGNVIAPGSACSPSPCVSADASPALLANPGTLTLSKS